MTADNFNITVGGQICNEISVLETQVQVYIIVFCTCDYLHFKLSRTFFHSPQINCEPPSEPPGGNTEAIVVVNNLLASYYKSMMYTIIDMISPLTFYLFSGEYWRVHQ